MTFSPCPKNCLSDALFCLGASQKSATHRPQGFGVPDSLWSRLMLFKSSR